MHGVSEPVDLPPVGFPPVGLPPPVWVGCPPQLPPAGALAHLHTLAAPAMTEGMASGGQAVATQGMRSMESEDWALSSHWQA